MISANAAYCTVVGSSGPGYQGTQRAMPAALALFWVGGRWVGLSAGAQKVYTSSDAVVWTATANLPATLVGSGGVNRIAAFKDRLYVVATDTATNTYYHSADGAAWTTSTLPASGIWAFEHNDNIVYAVDKNNVNHYQSTDGVTWSTLTLNDNGLPYTAAQLVGMIHSMGNPAPRPCGCPRAQRHWPMRPDGVATHRGAHQQLRVVHRMSGCSKSATKAASKSAKASVKKCQSARRAI